MFCLGSPCKHPTNSGRRGMCSGTARLPALDPVVHAGHLPLHSKTLNNVLRGLDRCLPMLMVPLREKWEGKAVSSVESDSSKAPPHGRTWRLIYLMREIYTNGIQDAIFPSASFQQLVHWRDSNVSKSKSPKDPRHLPDRSTWLDAYA